MLSYKCDGQQKEDSCSDRGKRSYSVSKACNRLLTVATLKCWECLELAQYSAVCAFKCRSSLTLATQTLCNDLFPDKTHSLGHEHVDVNKNVMEKLISVSCRIS